MQIILSKGKFSANNKKAIEAKRDKLKGEISHTYEIPEEEQGLYMFFNYHIESY